MKRFFLLVIAVFAILAINAANRVKDSDTEIESVMANSKLKFKKGDNSVFQPGQKIKWRNGVDPRNCNVVNCYNEKDEPDHVAFLLEECEDWESNKHYYEIKLVNGQPTVINQKGVTVKHELAGRWDMVVFRNASGAVLDVALRNNDNNNSESENDIRDMINGVYVGVGKNSADTVVFGMVYGEERNRLPGADYEIVCFDYENDTPKLRDVLQVAYCPERMKRVHMPVPSKKVDEKGVLHYYADGKEVSRDEYEFLESQPSGYGGHGSLHGPLMWNVKPQGNDLSVTLNEPFEETLDAYYSNFRDEKFTLKWVRSPYKGMKERWAVLSMRPVTRGMLVFCNKATMQEMLNYLKTRKTPTDIEKLNKSLINTMVNGTGSTLKSGKSSKSGRSRKSRR